MKVIVALPVPIVLDGAICSQALSDAAVQLAVGDADDNCTEPDPAVAGSHPDELPKINPDCASA